jgi:5'-nucleotidase
LMLILLTNDDGISAPGLVALYRELTTLGEIHVVAPASVQSAASHGITLSTPLLTSRMTVQDVFTGIAVDGRPADCVKLAVAQILPRRPDLVISGMNSGANVGINVIYSGLPSIAVSLHLRKEFPPDYSRSAKLARQTIDEILALGLRPGHVVSVNIPGLGPDESPAGLKIARQCTRPWVDTYERRKDPRGRDYFWNSSVFTLGPTDDDTDVAALSAGYITITPLQFDLTDHELLRKWQRGKFETRNSKLESNSKLE